MKTKNIVDFVNTTGANIGVIQNTKLGKYLKYSEGALRNLQKQNIQRYNCLYLGAFCEANNITKEELIRFLNREHN